MERSIMRKYILAYHLVIFGWTVFGQNKIHFEKSTALTHAKNLAKETRKPIFIDFYADWCGPCKWMERNIFSDGEVGNYINEHFINIKANIDLNGKNLAAQYQVHSLPTYIFIDSMGSVITKASGSMEKAEFMQLAQRALQHQDRTWARYEDRYLSGDRNPDFMMSYYRYLHSINHPQQFTIASEYIKSQPYWDTPENLEFILYHCNAVNDDKIYKYILQNKKLFYKQFKEPSVDSLLRLGIYLKLAGLPEDELVSQLDKEYSRAFPAKKDQYLYEHTLGTLWNGVMDHTVKMDSFSRAVTHYTTSYPKGNWTILRDMALNVCLACDQAPILLQSLKWATKALRSNSTDWLNNYTMAALFYRLGNNMSARTFIDKAKEVAVSDSNANVNMINELYALIDIKK